MDRTDTGFAFFVSRQAARSFTEMLTGTAAFCVGIGMEVGQLIPDVNIEPVKALAGLAIGAAGFVLMNRAVQETESV